MRVLIFFLLFSVFARGQVVIDWYRHVSTPVFFLNNAATPTPNEEADTDGWSTAATDAARVTLSVEPTDVQNGGDAIKALCDTDIVSAVDINLEFTGLTASTSYTIEFYTKRGAGAVNYTARLRSANGWSSDVAGSTISPTTYTLVSITGTTTGTTASLTLGSTTTFDAGDFILIDNLTIN